MQKLKHVPLLDRVLGLVEKIAEEVGTTPKRLVLVVGGFAALVLILAVV